MWQMAEYTSYSYMSVSEQEKQMHSLCMCTLRGIRGGNLSIRQHLRELMITTQMKQVYHTSVDHLDYDRHCCNSTVYTNYTMFCTR